MKGKLIIMSGPSGVGKGTICQSLVKDLKCFYSVSMTSRLPRFDEVDGVNYYFVSKDEFKKRIDEGMLIEYNVYNDNYYGTPKDKVIEKLDEGSNVILEIDVNGARNIKKIFPEALLIYISPPSLDTLRERLIGRGTDTIESINNRLRIARNEMEQIDMYDYVIINDDLNKAINDVKKAIEG